MKPTRRRSQLESQPETPRQGEVNLQDFLLLITILLGGLLLAGYAGERFGWLGFVLGCVLGLPVSFGVLYLFFALYALIEGVLRQGIPQLPRCANGTCRSGLLTDFGDYELEIDERNRPLFRCRCGLLYERESNPARVLKVLPDGTTEPYMVWQPFRGWQADHRSSE